MAAGRNPFVAESGARPPVLAGRDEQLTRMMRQLLELGDGHVVDPLVVTGREGMGRTAFAHEAARQARSHGWSPVVVAVEPGADLVVELARGFAAAALHRARRAGRSPMPELALARALARAAGADLPTEVDPAPLPPGTLADRAVHVARAVGRAVAEDDLRGGVSVFLDDAHVADPASRDVVLDVMEATTARPVRVAVVLLGLPGTGAPHHELGLPPLRIAEIADAVHRPAVAAGVEVTDEAVRHIARRCAGVPWFVQAVARAAWPGEQDPPVITADRVDAGLLAAEQAITCDFFGPVRDSLSPEESQWCRAAADLGDRASFPAVAHLLGDPAWFDRSRSVWGPVVDALASRGVLFGDDEHLCFAHPLFDRSLRADRRTDPAATS
jgi:hypothetical protein